MSEHSDQIQLAHWLNQRRNERGGKLLWTHFPAGYQRTKAGAIAAMRAGTLRGMPDVLIFDVPSYLTCNGIYIELKTGSGHASKAQTECHKRLEAAGWIGVVATLGTAIDWLRTLGIGA